MNKPHSVILASALLAACLLGGWPQAAVARQETKPAASPSSQAFTDVLQGLSADEATYFQHNATLSNPFFEGRAPGLRGNELAAEYVEFYFKRIGLEPLFTAESAAGDENRDSADEKGKGGARVSFRQKFPAGAESVLSRQGFMLGGKSLVPGGDYTVMAQSGTGEAEGEVVFIGYSIEKGPDDYSSFADKDGKDYEGADLAGKVAMILRFEPKNDKGKSRWGDGSGGWSGNSNLTPKLRRAATRGAAAIILVNPPGADDPRVDKLEDLKTGPRGPGARRLDVPVVMLSIDAATRLCQAAGKDLIELTKAADEHGGVTSLAGAGKVKIEAEIKREPTFTANVAGVLRGKGALADQYLIIGGHYDHVGMGAFGSRDPNGAGKLHPGADDNASGTSGVLLAAEKLSKQYKLLPADANVRSIIFMCFSAEESGLVGSAFFVRNPAIPAKDTYAMLNMDMIGRLRDSAGGLEVSGVGSAEGFLDILKPLFDKAPFKVKTLPGGMGPSDHASFYRAGVPVLHFFTGLHAEYHMPVDVYTTINTPGAVQVVNLLVESANILAARTDALTYTQAKGPSISMEQPGAQREGPAPIKVRFGIAPADYSDDKPGVPVGEVFEGTSAALAGIKAGDRLTHWNGEEVKSVEGWMQYLSKAKPGDIVQVMVTRGSEELTLPVTLKARDSGDR